MKIIYWTSTILISLFLTWSSYTYIFNKATISGIRELGFPDYFRIQLSILKVIAVILLLLPQIPIQYKEWAYSGVILFFITAIVAHTAHKDPFIITFINIILIAITVISNIYLYKTIN